MNLNATLCSIQKIISELHCIPHYLISPSGNICLINPEIFAKISLHNYQSWVSRCTSFRIGERQFRNHGAACLSRQFGGEFHPAGYRGGNSSPRNVIFTQDTPRAKIYVPFSLPDIGGQVLLSLVNFLCSPNKNNQREWRAKGRVASLNYHRKGKILSIKKNFNRCAFLLILSNI